MPWPGISLRLALLLWAASVGPPGLNAEQNIGCLFSERLCLEEEWCYDDYAFGRCLPSAGNLENSDYYRFDLEREELHELKRELERLFTLGYRWNHGYTQCRLQAMLYAIKHRIINEPDSCSHLVDQDLEGALKAMDIQVPIDPEQVAIIRYTPSDDDPRSEFADEVYYPPERNRNRNLIRDTILSPNAIDIMDMEDPSVNNRGNDYELTNTWSKRWIPQMHRRSLPYDYQPFDETNALDRLEYLSRNQQDHSNDREMYNTANNDKKDNSLNIEDLEDIYSVIDFMNKWQLRPTDLVKILTPESYERLKLKLEELEANLEANEELSNSVQTFLDAIINNEDTNPSNQRFAFPYNTPDNFRSGWEARDTVNRFNDLPEPRIYYDEMENPIEENGSGYQTPTDDIYRKLEMVEKPTERNRPVEGGIFRELQQKKLEEGAVEKRFGQGVYTEGGMVYPSPNKGESSEFESETHNFDLDHYWGFKRPERLDVKKPGPPFDHNINGNAKRRGFINEDNLILPSMMKKGPRSPIPNKNDIDFSDQEPDHVFVAFDRNFRTWKHGQDVIKNLSTLLQMDATDFDNGRVLGNVISFKVLPNSRGYNATEVARKISLRKKEIHLLTGLQVREVGTDREKVNAVFAAPLANNSDFYMMIFMVCGILGAIIISVALLILMRRHIKAREKLHGLSRPDTEASKDYQDLCRARMSKGQQPPGDNARITSLSKESEQSPSSRSSTSSWSEEPALHNMDISTGHMVLSYMEDHLKNKDRLDHEWEALCAYVAEPCATTIANLPDNKEKNRHPEVVPYDHARVLLNTLCNASGCDYINASSVTDHDPRHPAYLATQGPLPNTAADFWQLVWEQGAVVIVMLTRLTESGHAMCHRYWPEEGSELYHTYEVHLVSEHIWCDDYLVRSFYLKNTRTGETRTVTQFHFLSWSETGVPVSTKALLEFRRKVNKSYRGRSCPIVVHCSDGAGRTGTYCLIDMVLSRMAKGAKEIDIAATLEHLRDQRPGMVSSKQQFEFVLTAVAEEVHAILKALPAQPNPVPEKEK